MVPALLCTAVGLICVNIAELRNGLKDFDLWRYGSGILLAFVSVACWAWYALRNARWLRENPDKHPMMWATAQALVTLPVSLLGYVGACLWLGHQQPDFQTVGICCPDGGDCGAVFLGGRAVLEHCQPETANGDPGAADCFRNPGRAALYLPDAPERTACINGLWDCVAGRWGGDGGESEAGKTEGCVSIRSVIFAG